MTSKKVARYNIYSDLAFFKAIKATSPPIEMQQWSLVFDPSSLKKTIKSWNLADHMLSQDQLLNYAKLATKIRKALSDKADSKIAVEDSSQGEE
jgi:hypothetical protein